MIGPGFSERLAGAQAGDERAFAALWRDLNPPLVRYCRTLADAAGEDVASETWLAVLRALRGFTGDEPHWRAWVFTIARRKVIDAARRGRPGRLRPLTELTPADEPAGPDAAAGAEESAGTRAALACIARLPRDQAEIVVLRVVVGLDVAQVAQLVGKSPGAVRVSAHRGLRRLAAMLEQAGPGAVTLAEVAAFRLRDD